MGGTSALSLATQKTAPTDLRGTSPIFHRGEAHTTDGFLARIFAAYYVQLSGPVLHAFGMVPIRFPI